MDIKHRIVPIPKEIDISPDSRVVLGCTGKPDFKTVDRTGSDDILIESAISLVSGHLSGVLNVNADESDGKVAVEFYLRDTAPERVKNAGQAYEIEISENRVSLTGFGPLGLFYAAVTLKQMIAAEDNMVCLPHLKICDWPDMETRGHFVESRYGTNLMTLEDWKRVIDNLSEYKMNKLNISVYGCWCVQYDGRISEYMYVPVSKYPKLKTPVVIRYFSPRENKWIDGERLPPMFEQDFLGELMAYGRTKGVEVFPLFNSFGHNTLIPRMYSEVSSKDEAGNPKGLAYCVSNEKTYELIFDIFDEIIDKYCAPNGIDSFHIGMDEVRTEIAVDLSDLYKEVSPWCECPECRKISNEDKFLNHAIRLISHLKARGMKNIYIYNDMIKGFYDKFAKAVFENNLQDCVVVDWWTYTAFYENMYKTLMPETGLRRIVKPWNGYYHWTILINTLKNIYMHAQLANNDGAEGMQSYSGWDESFDRNNFCIALYAWNFAAAGDTESVTDYYAMHNFGAKYKEARRAFSLIDFIAEQRNGEYKNGDKVISNFALLNAKLCHYFYSYVKKDKPYPRIYPGEAVAEIMARREEYRRVMLEIAAMSRQARTLLSEIASDARCNMRLAERFAYEAENYRCLVEDFLAILDMMDISESGSDNRFEIIKEMADSRISKRLLLMAHLERIKEEYLMASHMRMHSILLKFFEDLKAYLSCTPKEDIKLDFYDMRYLESETAWKLR